MKKFLRKTIVFHLLTFFLLAGVFFFINSAPIFADDGNCKDVNRLDYPACTSIDTGDLGFKIPSLGDLLTFAIRAFFVIAGLAGLFYLLLGALGWVTSGGDKDAVTAAREKIQAAVLGMILIVAVLAIIWTLEQVIFNRRICFGLSCGLTLPGLLEKSGDTAVSWVPTGAGTGYNVTSSSTDDAACCICKKDDGTFGEVVNSRYVKCGVNGTGEPL